MPCGYYEIVTAATVKDLEVFKVIAAEKGISLRESARGFELHHASWGYPAELRKQGDSWALCYDNYEHKEKLSGLLQSYSIMKVKKEAKARGFTFTAAATNEKGNLTLKLRKF